MRLVFTGGGSGGHVVPNLAVIAALRKSEKNLNLLYIGSKSLLERDLVRAQNVPYRAIQAGKLRRYFSWQNFSDFFRIPVGIIQSFFILRKFKPQLLFSKGGFVSLPPVIAAWILRIPIICHESDLKSGLANRITFRFAKMICCSFPETAEKLQKYKNKIQITGTPLRPEIFAGSAKKAEITLAFPSKKPVLLIIGGSQGALEINNLIDQNLTELLQKFNIIHIRGEEAKTEISGYKSFKFVQEELPDFYQLADIIISRAGANSLAELAAINKKVILIPLNTNASRGDQIDNAKYYQKHYHWPLLLDPNFPELREALAATSQNPSIEAPSLNRNAAQRLGELISRTCKSQ